MLAGGMREENYLESPKSENMPNFLECRGPTLYELSSSLA